MGKEWCAQIHFLKSMTIERTYFSFPLELAKEFEQYIFSEASSRAYGAVAYFRYESNNGCI